MKKLNFNVNQKSFIFLIGYSIVILAIILLGLLPLYFKTSNQIKENDKLKAQIQEQKELAPVYASVLNAGKEKNLFVLPNPEKTPLPRSDSGKFEKDFQTMAQKSGLKVVALTPDVNTSTSPSTSFLHYAVLNGEWNDLRKLMIELGGLPYLDKIEEISMQQGTGSMELKMKVSIAVK
jgi:ankyrin repeat protein